MDFFIIEILCEVFIYFDIDFMYFVGLWEDIYFYFFVNIGFGVFIFKVSGWNLYECVGGIFFGGGMFWGLLLFLMGVWIFDDMFD